MLYFVQAELIGDYPVPPEQWFDLVVKHLEFILEYKKKGKILIHGAFVGRQSGCFIWNVDSNEELHSLLTQQPLWPFMDWDIIPLISTEHALKSVQQSIASLGKVKE